MQGTTGITPQSGRMSRFRFIAKNWYEPAACLETLQIEQKNLDRLRQQLKKQFPEILQKNNPIAARQLGIA